MSFPLDEGESTAKDEWEVWWDARVAAMESILGKSESEIFHAPIPIYLEPEGMGAADVIYFRHHVEGVVYVTSDLIGCELQVPNELGNYELMICHREDHDWGPTIISQLARYTLQTELKPGDTMDIESAVPEGSKITALLFFDYARFTVRGHNSGLLLCVGITASELNACRNGRRLLVERALKESGVYPFTDLTRQSVKVRKQS
jgi:hypothetical protein